MCDDRKWWLVALAIWISGCGSEGVAFKATGDEVPPGEAKSKAVCEITIPSCPKDLQLDRKTFIDTKAEVGTEACLKRAQDWYEHCGTCQTVKAQHRIGNEVLANRDYPSQNDPGALTIHVAPHGSDANVGSESAPLSSLKGARDLLRKMRQEKRPLGPVLIRVHSGVYSSSGSEALSLESLDAGNFGSPVLVEGHGEETPVFTTAVEIANADWIKSEATQHRDKGVYKVPLSSHPLLKSTTDIETLFVGDPRWHASDHASVSPRAILARSPTSGEFYKMRRPSETELTHIPGEYLQARYAGSGLRTIRNDAFLPDPSSSALLDSAAFGRTKIVAYLQ